MPFFSRPGTCILICETTGRVIKTPAEFRRAFDLEIGFVPVLGPVEHNEQLYNKEAAREALLSHRASRNFRNIWHHYPAHFEVFRELVRTTWPGMDIKRPEVDTSHDKPLLRMFCPENRMDREIYWAGFGFQVWCQMLTYMAANRTASLFIIDEPDIYLHSDLQRQLVNELRALGPDILIATHSTEMLFEAEPEDILWIEKTAKSARRIAKDTELRKVFDVLGSAVKPVLTQIAKTSKVLFVEGDDFRIVSLFAARLGARTVAQRTAFAVVPAGGFNPHNVRMFKEGVEASIGAPVTAAVLFDRDFRSREQVAVEEEQLRKYCDYAHIHECKEIENFLLIPSAIARALVRRARERSKDVPVELDSPEKVTDLLVRLSEQFKVHVQAQLLKNAKARQSSIDESTTYAAVLNQFDRDWVDTSLRLRIVPGKALLASLNSELQDTYNLSLSPRTIIESMSVDDVPPEMRFVVESLEAFANSKVAQAD